MKDVRKRSHEQHKAPAGLSAGRALQVKLWAELLKTAALALASLSVLVLGSTAWFVSNSKVDSGGVEITHRYDTIRLATKGYRQTAEIDHQSTLQLVDGTVHEYGKPAESYYVTEENEIALRLSDEKIDVSPGMSGDISFYIIPKHTGPQTVNLYLALAGYDEDAQHNSDDVLASLLSGHILLFKKENSEDLWLEGSVSQGKVHYQITAANPSAVEGTPWQVTLRWVWPLRYENMKKDYDGRFDSFIEQQAGNLQTIDATDYSYSQIFLTKTPDKLINGEEESILEARSDAYNQADEYIGKNAKYLYVTIKTDRAE